jgi:fucose permease
MTVSGWIPSYAVMVKILNRKEATVYGTFFWSVSTIFRFIAAALTIRNSVKLKLLLLSVLVCSIACFTLNYLQYFGAAALVGSLCYGMACSAVFPLLVSISLEYGIEFRKDQISNMMIAPVLSSMCIAGVTGRLMHENIDMLFWSLLAMSSILVVDGVLIFREMRKVRQDADSRVQITHK